MLRDSIDYKGTAVGKLFRRFLFPSKINIQLNYLIIKYIV